MPAKKAPPADAPTPTYPNLERFLEQADRDSAAKLFAATRKKLDALAGPKAATAKKALAAIERVEGLLGELYAVRVDLEAQARKAKSTRR